MIGFIRYGTDAQKRDFIDFTRVRDSGSFHVGAETVVSVPKFARLLRLADELVAA